jgi:hypothetical protein
MVMDFASQCSPLVHVSAHPRQERIGSGSFRPSHERIQSRNSRIAAVCNSRKASVSAPVVGEVGSLIYLAVATLIAEKG